MIKIILTTLFKSSTAIKVFFIGVLETIGRSFDNLNYYIIHPIRLIRFQDVREFLADYYFYILLITSVLAFTFLLYNNNNKSRRDNTSWKIYIWD